MAIAARVEEDRPAGELIAAARRAGADGVELCWTHLAGAEGGADALVLEVLAGYGKPVLASVRLAALGAQREDELAEAVSRLCEQAAAAGRLGVRAVCLAAGGCETVSSGALIRGLGRLLEIAETSGLSVHVVNGPGTALEQIEDVRGVFGVLRHPALRLRIDTGAFYAAAVNPRDVLAEFADRVGSVELTDRRGRQQVEVGTGRVNLEGFAADAARLGYDGWFLVRGDLEGAATRVARVRRLMAGERDWRGES